MKASGAIWAALTLSACSFAARRPTPTEPCVRAGYRVGLDTAGAIATGTLAVASWLLAPNVTEACTDSIPPKCTARTSTTLVGLGFAFGLVAGTYAVSAAYGRGVDAECDAVDPISPPSSPQ